MTTPHVHTLGTDDKPGTLLRIVAVPPSEGTTVIHALGSTTVKPCERALFVAMPAFSRLPGEGEDEPVPCVFVPKVADHE